MDYKKAMKWHKRHPKGIRNLYFGFDSHTPRPKPTKEEVVAFYPTYLAFHQKNKTPAILTLDEYIAMRVKS